MGLLHIECTVYGPQGHQNNNLHSCTAAFALVPYATIEQCYLRVIKHSLKVNFTLWEVNFQCTKFHLVPCRKEFCKECSEIDNSSFIGEYSIIEAQEWEIRSSSSQAIMVYNSKNDDYYQSFKDPQKWPFYNLPWKQISIINTLFIKSSLMLSTSGKPLTPAFIHSFFNQQIFIECLPRQRCLAVMSEMHWKGTEMFFTAWIGNNL